MKVTHFSRAGFPLALGGWSTGSISVNSNFNTTDGGFSAANFVQGITANGSNMLLRPIANIAAGSNIWLSLDSGPGGSIPSNTIRIHSTASGGGNIITANGSNSLAAVVNLKAGTGIALGVSGQDVTITNTGTGSGGGSSTFVGARAYHSTTQSIPNATATVLSLNSEEFDTDAFHDTATNNSRMTVPAGQAGKYIIMGGTGFASSGGGTYRIIAITKNGAAVAPHMRRGIAPSDPAFGITTMLDLAVGDYVEVLVYQDSGGNLNVGDATNAEFRNSLSITKIQGGGGGSSDLAGFEYDYVEITSAVTVTATTEATATTIVTGSAVSYDGATKIMVEYWFPYMEQQTNTFSVIAVLYDGSSSIGLMGILTTSQNGNMRMVAKGERRLTPSNASHTYSIRAYKDGGTAIVGAGTGGSGNHMPGFIRITKV